MYTADEALKSGILLERYTVRLGADGLEVESPSGAYRARKAASCLIEPGDGDTVIAALDGDTAYIVAVLIRADESAPAEMVFPSGAAVYSGGAISLSAAERIEMDALEIEQRGEKGKFVFGETGFFTKIFRGSLDRVNIIAGIVDNIYTHLIQRMKLSSRHVEQVDESRAGMKKELVDGPLQIHSKSADITADGLIRIDADTINLG